MLARLLFGLSRGACDRPVPSPYTFSACSARTVRTSCHRWMLLMGRLSTTRKKNAAARNTNRSRAAFRENGRTDAASSLQGTTSIFVTGTPVRFKLFVRPAESSSSPRERHPELEI